MKRTFKKTMSMLFVAVMIFGIMGNMFSVKTSAAKITDYKVGDIIEFGWYPQSEVKDEAIIAELNKIDGEWVSYGYYSGNGNQNDIQQAPGDFMRYKDVVYGTERYRGVVFDAYRPGSTFSETTTISYGTIQARNGYYINTVYWFKYEPIKWRVLDPDTGMVISENILDVQAFNNYCSTYGVTNNYMLSSIRNWLNNDFYGLAFSVAQQNEIDYASFEDLTENLHDKIYLLSANDALNVEYGFKTEFDRRTRGNDYARCQGLIQATHEDYYGKSYWYLRTPNEEVYQMVWSVDQDGVVSEKFYTYNTFMGIRPAMNLNTTAEIKNSEYAVLPEIIEEDFIKKPSTSTINYGDTLILHTDSSKIPVDATIEWSVEGESVAIEPSVDGKTCAVTSKATGNVKIIAKYVDADGIKHISEQEIKSKASIWHKIISLIKNLFGMNRIIEQ